MVDVAETRLATPALHADYRYGSQIYYGIGVDLGQSIDPSVLALIEREVVTTDEFEAFPGRGEGTTEHRAKRVLRFRLRGLSRLPTGTNYHDVADHIAARHLLTEQHGPTNLLFDETGNRAAGDMIRDRVPGAIGCTLTASEDDNQTMANRWSISKANMVTALLAAIENRELELADDLDDIDAFKAHLSDLRRKVSNMGKATFNAAEGAHDDYVTAAGLAYWACRNRYLLNRSVGVLPIIGV